MAASPSPRARIGPSGSGISTRGPSGSRSLATLSGHADMLWACAISPDGSFIVSGGADKTLKVWDLVSEEPLSDLYRLRSWRERATLLGHAFWVTGCAIAPDASFIVSAGDRGLRIWDLARVRETAPASRHVHMVTDCDVSRDGDFIVTASDDDTMKVWDGTTGTERATLVGHTGRVLGCSVNADGTRIASAGTDNTVRLWDAATGAELTTLTGHTDPVWDCAIGSDGSFVVSASEDR